MVMYRVIHELHSGGDTASHIGPHFKHLYLIILMFFRWCSSVPIVKRPTQKSSYVHISYVGASKEMKIVENYEMKLFVLKYLLLNIMRHKVLDSPPGHSCPAPGTPP